MLDDTDSVRLFNILFIAFIMLSLVMFSYILVNR